jgi:hypothetical protein
LLRQPQQLAALTLAGWDALVRQARRAGLLARIGSMLEAQGSLARVPRSARAHLDAAMMLSEFHRAQAMRTLALVQEALAPTQVEPVIVGGAAYVAAGLLPAMGRVFTDIEVVVPAGRLAEVRTALLVRGWSDAPNTRTQEIAQRGEIRGWGSLIRDRCRCALVVHDERGTPAGRDVDRLDDFAGLAVPDPAGMVLHAMVKLFHRMDIGHGLRDLSDLDLLLRHYGRMPDFWTRLEQRARDADALGSLCQGLRFAQGLLGTPVPPGTLEQVAARDARPLLRALNDQVWSRALRPRHSMVSDRWSRPALFALRFKARGRQVAPALVLQRPSFAAV